MYTLETLSIEVYWEEKQEDLSVAGDSPEGKAVAAMQALHP